MLGKKGKKGKKGKSMLCTYVCMYVPYCLSIYDTAFLAKKEEVMNRSSSAIQVSELASRPGIIYVRVRDLTLLRRMGSITFAPFCHCLPFVRGGAFD